MMPSGKSCGLAALIHRHEGAAGVEAAHREHERAGLLVEVMVRLAELQRHEVLRIGAGVDQLLDPGEDGDDARILEGELAGEELAVVVEAELAQQRLAEDIGAGIGPVAHALRDRRHIGGARLLHQVEELRLVELVAGRQRDAELRQPVLVVVELVGIGLLGQRPGLAVMGPDLAGPVIDVVPVRPDCRAG